MSEKEWEAGAALDAEIARRVFNLVSCDGWERFNLGSAGGPALRKRCDHENGACYPSFSIGSIQGRIGGCPRYSTDVAAAWLVQEHLWERHGLAIRIERDPLESQPFCVTFEDGEGFDAWERADTMPLAVCRAALDTLESQP